MGNRQYWRARRHPSTASGYTNTKRWGTFRIVTLEREYGSGGGETVALSIARAYDFRAVVAQNDMMAMGARRAFEKVSDDSERQAWLALPFLGADGLPKTEQACRSRLTCNPIPSLVSNPSPLQKSHGAVFDPRTMSANGT